jgi:hypothetical protein
LGKIAILGQPPSLQLPALHLVVYHRSARLGTQDIVLIPLDKTQLALIAVFLNTGIYGFEIIGITHFFNRMGPCLNSGIGDPGTPAMAAPNDLAFSTIFSVSSESESEFMILPFQFVMPARWNGQNSRARF